MAIEIGRVTNVRTYEQAPGGSDKPVRLNKRQEMIAISPFGQAVADKNVFQAVIGSATTPVSFVKTAYDADQPQLVIDVPSGTTIMPLELEVVLEDSAGTDNEVIWLASGTNVGAGTSTVVTPVNLFVTSSANAPASRCSGFRQYTGNGTDPNTGEFFEFYRTVYAFADATTDPVKRFRWSALESPAPIIEGTGSLVLYIVGTTTAPAGFVIAKWWEVLTGEM